MPIIFYPIDFAWCPNLKSSQLTVLKEYLKDIHGADKFLTLPCV